MEYSNRDKVERKSGRAGFVDLDSKIFGVGGKMPQTNARRVRYPTRFANGNRLGQNDPHPPAADVEDGRRAHSRPTEFVSVWNTALPHALSTIAGMTPIAYPDPKLVRKRFLVQRRSAANR